MIYKKTIYFRHPETNTHGVEANVMSTKQTAP